MLPFCSVNSIMSFPKGNLVKLASALVSLMNQLNNFPYDEK